MALLASIGVGLYVAQASSRDQLLNRFDLRISLSSRFLASYIEEIIAREQAVGAEVLGNESVSKEQFEQVVAAFGFEAAILLDADGRVIQVYPSKPTLIGTAIASRYAHLSQAVAGTPAVSNVVASAARGVPVVAFAAPYPTAHGRRVLSGAYEVSQTPISTYLRNALTASSGQIFLVDGAGIVAASNGAVAAQPVALASEAPNLADAITADQSGTIKDSAGTPYRFDTEDVPGSPLRVVGAIPVATLYEPVQGPAQWLPWLVFLALIAAATYLAWLFLELSRSRALLATSARELGRSNAELDRFASVASHDLQEPLRKIQAFGDRLEARAADRLDAESSDYLNRMQNAAARMQTLITDLLEYSRISSRPAAADTVDLNVIVKDVLTDLEARVISTNALVDVGPLPTIMGSSLQMRQLFQNLIGNGLKFHRSDVPSRLSIESRTSHDGGAGGVVVTVTDNGIGFDEEHRELIFAPFQRLHGRAEFEGTGIGLAICRRIVELHGGKLSASSQPGNGAIFTIVLPASALAGPRQKSA